MINNYSISIIIPVYNEIEIIESSISKISTFILDHFSNYELIIVESGSTDGSRELCDKLCAIHKNIKIIHESKRNGFGSALKFGFKNADEDLVCVVTLDLPFPLESIVKAVPYFSKYDCVLSYRSNDNRNWKRKLQSYVYNAIVKFMLGLKVKHVNSAFKIYKRESIQNMELISNGWFIDAEIIYLLQKKNISFIELPVELFDRTEGQSKISLSTPLTIIKELFTFMKSVN